MADAEQEKYEAAMEGEQSVQQPTHLPGHPAPVHHERKKHAQFEKPSVMKRLKGFLKECLRVYKITKKPDKQEFTTIVKISGLGILVIGAVGFLIHMADRLIFG